MKDRIIKFLTHENISATRFADEIGVQRSSISHILSGRNNPSYEFIYKILSRYKYLNAEWLIMGFGNMLKKTESNQTNPLVTSNLKQLDLFQNNIDKSVHGDTVKNAPGTSVTPEPTVSGTRKIDKIVLFYSDKTFEEFFPGQNS